MWIDLQARFNDAAPQSLTEEEHTGQSADYLAAEAKRATMEAKSSGSFLVVRAARIRFERGD